MYDTLFKPWRTELPQRLLLIPQFWDKPYYNKLKQEAIVDYRLVESEVLVFPEYAVISGFLGYPHILTVLEYIEDVKEKEIYFLGTAGSMNEEINQPIPMQTGEIFSSAVLDHFHAEKSFEMKLFPNSHMRTVTGVTVDIIQRETVPWLKEQKERGIDFVEMEIFPIRAYLDKPFHALVVSSDLLRESGIQVFKNRKRVQEVFIQTFEFLKKHVEQ